jgi:hypothetical protein
MSARKTTVIRGVSVVAAFVMLSALPSIIPLEAAVAGPTVDDLVPSVRCGFPNLGGNYAVPVPPTFRVLVEAQDPDDPSGRPWKYRFLWIPAVTEQGVTVHYDASYERHRDELITWDDPLWSGWIDYPESGDAPALVFTGLLHDDLYLLALQVMDHDGAVSTKRGYQEEVANVRVSKWRYWPEVVLMDHYLQYTTISVNRDEIATDQPVSFQWSADASSYNATIVSYRYGWNLIDAEDPYDPGWAVLPGLTPAHRRSVERKFSTGGIQEFTLRVVDSAGISGVYSWTLDVIPYVAYDDQAPLLFIDQVNDTDSGRWVSESGVPLDHQMYRNAYWHFLAETQGVVGFDWDSDFLEEGQTSELAYSDLVGYKAVLCTARSSRWQYFLNGFRPFYDADKFVWLAPYQWQGGNFFLVGERSLDSFIEVKQNYYVPTIFDTTEPDLNAYETSFGTKELPDGSELARGPLMYHYATVGISALDWSTSSLKTIYGSSVRASRDRTTECAGIKGLVLDQEFKSRHSIGLGVVADTLYTDTEIDWHDYQAQQAGTLELNSSDFSFLDDEFVDANISPRNTPIVPQQCSEGPEGSCIEPMFTGIARFDYVREWNRAAGNIDWPVGDYTTAELEDLCGELALSDHEGQPNSGARTNGQTYGFFSHKTVDRKPSGKADVYWGFDPYRFDHGETQKAVRWVLDYFGLEVGQ